MQRILWYLPILCCSAGCMSWRSGTVTPVALGPEVQAQAATKLKSLQLASLGTPVQSEYRIQPGDLLEVTISDLVGENQFYPLPARVLTDGTIRLPLVGPVAVVGLSFPEAEQTIFATYSSQGLLHKPLVTVTLRETRKIHIYVLGAVNKPGQYELTANECDLLTGLVAAGGLTPDAGTIIEVRRRVVDGLHLSQEPRIDRNVLPSSYVAPPPEAANGNSPSSLDADAPMHAVSPYSPIHYPQPRQLPPFVQEDAGSPGLVAQTAAQEVTPESASFNSGTGIEQVVHLDLTNESAKQKVVRGFRLQNGDTISIDDRKSRPIYVVGMVNKPGEYPMPVDRDFRVLEAIGLAGGVDRASLPNKAIVTRQRPDGSGVIAVRIDLDKAKRDNSENIRLVQGDTVSVEETFASFSRGLLRNAVRFGLGATVTPNYGF